MILITDVQMQNIDKNSVEINSYDPDFFITKPYSDTVAPIKIKREVVYGERFRNSNGLDVVIGMDRKTKKLLGLPFTAFKDMNRRRESDYAENTKLRKELRKYKEMTVFGKLKFLFKKELL